MLINAQEYKNLKAYQKAHGTAILKTGYWLKNDRNQDNERWHKANEFNLSTIDGFKKYNSIREIRDFYIWYDMQRIKKGHEITFAGIASIAATQLSKLDNGFIRVFIVRNKEVIQFANTGSKMVFEFAFQQMQHVNSYNGQLKGQEAINWNLNYHKTEQCTILDPLYKKLSSRALKKLSRMAKRKGIYKLGVPKQLRYEGDLMNCEDRIKHAALKLAPYYDQSH